MENIKIIEIAFFILIYIMLICFSKIYNKYLEKIKITKKFNLLSKKEQENILFIIEKLSISVITTLIVVILIVIIVIYYLL